MNEISLYFSYDICDEDIMVLFCDYVHVCFLNRQKIIIPKNYIPISSDLFLLNNFRAHIPTNYIHSWGTSCTLRQRIEAIKKHCKTNPKKLMRPFLFIGEMVPVYPCKISLLCPSLSRKDTYEGTWLYYVELAVKGAHKLLSSTSVFLLPLLILWKLFRWIPHHLQNTPL